MRHDGLVNHEQSEGHKNACEINKNKSASTSTAEKKTLQSLNKSVLEKLEKLFRNSHALAKASRPLTDFTWMARENGH